MTNPIAAEIAKNLEGLSPDEIRTYLAKVRSDSIAQTVEKKEQQAARQAEIENLSTDELTSELERYNPRHSDRERYQVVRAELKRKQKVAAVEANMRTMPSDEYQKLQARRDEINQDIQAMGKNMTRNIGKIRTLNKELSELMAAEPDAVLPPAAAKEKETTS